MSISKSVVALAATPAATPAAPPVVAPSGSSVVVPAAPPVGPLLESSVATPPAGGGADIALRDAPKGAPNKSAANPASVYSFLASASERLRPACDLSATACNNSCGTSIPPTVIAPLRARVPTVSPGRVLSFKVSAISEANFVAASGPSNPTNLDKGLKINGTISSDA